MYKSIRVVTPVMRSDHKAVVAYAEHLQLTVKEKTKKLYRQVTPAQHALFLQHISKLDFDISNDPSTDTQSLFYCFYDSVLQLLNSFYPERTITMTTRDPDYMTAGIKAKLRRKNRLMHAGRVEEAEALTVRIGKDIASRNKTRLSHIDSKGNAKDMWVAYRHLTGSKQRVNVVDGISADSLNQHYAAISTDTSYQPPPRKQTATSNVTEVVSEWRMFNLLDHLCATATGPDQLPAWFLRLGAPLFYKPLTHLFNVSISTGVIPRQWKAASICPVPKISSPVSLTDFCPISITSVLSRVMERLVVRQFIYPALLAPPPSLAFNDQFAFRPSGSTTAAIIAILQTVTNLLSDHPYVIVIGLDFSKAFDTVRHATLLQKFAQLDIPDAVYNWLVDYFAGHSHSTKYGCSTSSVCQISASIVQGSAIGPVSYVVNASDLRAATPGNELSRFCATFCGT